MSLLFYIACHFLGDFGLRPHIFEGKSEKSLLGRILLALHSLTYSATFVIFLKITWFPFLLLFLSHCLIDWFIGSGRYLKWQKKEIILDQGLHLGIILLIYFLL